MNVDRQGFAGHARPGNSAADSFRCPLRAIDRFPGVGTVELDFDIKDPPVTQGPAGPLLKQSIPGVGKGYRGCFGQRRRREIDDRLQSRGRAGGHRAPESVCAIAISMGRALR